MKKLILLQFLTILLACGSKENQRAIKGLAPIDVYMNLENMGYTTDKSLGGDLKLWTNTKFVHGGKFIVETNSSDTKTVEFVRATAQVDVTGDINNSKDFFKFITSLPYQGSNHETSTKWLTENFNKKESDTIVNGVKFSLKSPSKMVKILQLQKQ